MVEAHSRKNLQQKGVGFNWFIWPNMGIWAYAKKIRPNGVSPKRASKMKLRDVDLRSVGHSIQKLWPKTFFSPKKCLVFYLIKLKI